MTDEATAIKGVKLRKIDGTLYLVIKISEMFPGAPPTVHGLAQAIAQKDSDVWACLLGYKADAPAVKAMWKSEIGGSLPGGDPNSQLRAMRAQLRQKGNQVSIIGSGRHLQLIQTPYVNFGVQSEGDVPIIMPLSSSFRKSLMQAEDKAKRERKRQALKPAFESLKNQLNEIERKAAALESRIDSYARMTETERNELALLEMLDSMLAVMGLAPKNPPVDFNDRKSIETVKNSLVDFKNACHKAMIVEPTSPILRDTLRQRDAFADQVDALLHEASFLNNIQAAAENWEFVDTFLENRICDVLLFSYGTLFLTKRGLTVVQSDVLAMIDNLASADLQKQLALVKPTGNLIYDNALKAKTIPSKTRNALTLLSGTAGMLPAVMGNMPGPSSLSVGIMDMAGALLVKVVDNSRDQSATLAGKFSRALVNATKISSENTAKLVEAVAGQRVDGLKRIDWTSRMMKGKTVMSCVGVCCIIGFIFAVTGDTSNTLKKWADILSTGTGSVLAISAALSNLSALSNSRVIGALAKGGMGKALGVVGGAAAAVSGTITAIEEHDAGDLPGFWIATAGAAGSAIGVGGFLISAGFGAEASVLGVPVGVALQIVGGVLIIGSLVFGVLREVSMVGTDLVFDTILNQFAREFGPFDLEKTRSPHLEGMLRALRIAHNDADYWDIAPSHAQMLADYKFPRNFVARAVDEDESTLTGVIWDR